MPVIQVFAAPVADAAAKLEAMCRAVASALGLDPAGVIATHIRVEQTVIPGQPDAAWPVVTIHGSARAQEQMQDARDRVAALAATWSSTSGHGVWVSWQLPVL
jgi:hypothetical protein